MTTNISSRIPWTEEESAYVLASFPAQSVTQIADHLRRSRGSVQGRVASLQRAGKLPYLDGSWTLTTEEQKQRLRDTIVGLATTHGVVTVEMTRSHPMLAAYTGNDVETAVWTLINQRVLTFDQKTYDLRLCSVAA